MSVSRSFGRLLNLDPECGRIQEEISTHLEARGTAVVRRSACRSQEERYMLNATLGNWRRMAGSWLGPGLIPYRC